MTTAASPLTLRSAGQFKDVWLISIGHGMTHWYTATFYLLLPLIGLELGLSYAQIGLIMTVQHAVGAISNVPGGVFVDTVGRRGLLMAMSLFWIGFPYLLMGFSHEYWMILACVTLVGIGNNIWHPAAISTLADRYPKNKGLMLSVHGMGGNVGEAFAPLVVGVLLTAWTWREVVVMNVVPGAFASLLLLAMLGALPGVHRRRDPALEARAERSPDRPFLREALALLRNRSMMLICASAACRTMTQTALLTFLPLYLARNLGYSTAWVGLCLFALQGAAFAASPIAGHLSDRMGRARIVIGSTVMSAVVLVAMLFAGDSAWFVFLVALLGFFLYAVRPVLQAWMLETTPRSVAGTSVGLMFGIQHVGAAIAPLGAGLIADAHGLPALFWALAATILLANLFIYFMPRDAFARA
jgi:sugar phosphate permease